MVTTTSAELSRRRFLAAGSLAFASACIASKRLFAEEDHLVNDALKEAATAKMTVQTLRRNISVLLGAGGNIAVLTGTDGKNRGDIATTESILKICVGVETERQDHEPKRDPPRSTHSG